VPTLRDVGHSCRVHVRANRGWDYWPFVPAAGAVAVGIGYLHLINEQGNEPAMWFPIGLAVAAVTALYAARRQSLRRAGALRLSAAMLIVLGVLALWSVGLPLLIAGVVALYAADRVREPDRAPG
jgi:hypothetical protein